MLIALYFHNQNQKVAIVTSQEFLVVQLRFMMGYLRQKVDVLTMKKAIVSQVKYDQIIIDEADDCIINEGSLIDHQNNKFVGFWDLLETPTILLTATMSQAMEDLMHNLYNMVQSEVHSFNELINDEEAKLPQASISYFVSADFEEAD